VKTPRPDSGQLIRTAIHDWRDSLINLTGTNRLLNYRPSKTGTVDIVRPESAVILAGLTAGRQFQFRSLKPKPAEQASGGEQADATSLQLASQLAVPQTTPPPAAANILDSNKDPVELASALRNLMRRSNQEYLDRGLWVLYLAFGTVTWSDADDTSYTSPLLLIPVRLDSAGPRQMPYLSSTDEDPQINPALALKLAQSNIMLPSVDELEDVEIAGLLAATRAAVESQDGWTVADTVSLSYFSFAKEAMYRDLLDHEEIIAEHAAITALATGGRGEEIREFLFDEIADEHLDAIAPPETTPLVLDADSSQRTAIAAAVEGRSFVMDGPPGTGKSQTISNMIGALLAAGKSVLFVSEKAAALEVVRNRLTDVGLGAYLLELHSHNATRREVAIALGTALDTVPVAPAPLGAIDIDKARQRRQELSAYSEAMNAPREPLNYSLHDVLGMIAQLIDVPAAPATGVAPVDLTVELFGELRATAATLARAWRPAVEGPTFVWRGVTATGSMEARLYRAVSALGRLTGVVRTNQPLAEAFAVTRPSQAQTLATVLECLATRPPGTPDAWLTVDTLADVEASVNRLVNDLADIAAAEHAASATAQVPWKTIPALTPIDRSALHALRAEPVGVDELTIEEAARLAAIFRAQADMLDSRGKSLAGIASMMGMPTPESFTDAHQLLRVAAIAQVDERPERGWLTPGGCAAAHTASATLKDAIDALTVAGAEAGQFYGASALGEDLDALAERFQTAHRGLHKLSGQYRRDKATVRAFANEAVPKRAALNNLRLAVAWKHAATALTRAEGEYAPVLGSYYAGRSTDFARLAAALAHAATVVAWTGDADTSRLADHIAVDAAPNTAMIGVTTDTARDLREFTATLAPAPLATGRPELAAGTLREASHWLRTHVVTLASCVDLAQQVTEAVGRPVTIGEATQLVSLRRSADAAHVRLRDRAPEYGATCDQLFTAERTDPAVLKAALDWARHTRGALHGVDTPLTTSELKAFNAATPTPHLSDAITNWTTATAELMSAFDPARQRELVTELDDYDDAADLLAVMSTDDAGQQEWLTYTQARTALRERGLDTAVEFCISERITAGLVPSVLERALLQEWADHHLASDPALKTVRSQDRDALVTEYRELDRRLISAAVGDIIRACNSRRPRTDLGQAAVIRREAGKKKRHMPVRQLIEKTQHVVQAIKPCFMMSPLAVSQYLPSTMRFDAVIFDEASQVSPADAINCIYRGNALITAGDQKQLPPTNFFAAASTDDSEEWTDESENSKDFESILDLAKASGAFKSLTLRWHYRSRHESLIAFSNASFYNGRLVTFPGADTEGPNVGIELFVVPGIYRRGTSRDNPIEAAQVAERVIHHFDTRPAMSLGVVAFSEAQAATIETAVDSARLARPDLDRFFTGDRLDGFFVKNLESVQGDERDVMIFSIGYGPDENGKTTMNFGPINRPGGWRRLNVAVTRARYRNEIVSSLTAADITATNAEGVRHLRRYLDYAARGQAALALDLPTGRDAESPFEESVLSAIRSWGYAASPQVGAAGYRIDIGVHHPHHPGVYVLGVECDGFYYHSSKVARDRDRLREQVLRGLGWHLHRIWGTAWYRNRNGEEQRLRAAIEAATRAPIHGLLADPGRDRIDRPSVGVQPASFDERPPWAAPYRTAKVKPLGHWIDPGSPGARYDMPPGIMAIAEAEAPVHLSVIHQRLREAWNIGRVGKNIRDNIDDAITLSEVVRDGDFVLLPDHNVEQVRTPTDACARTIEQVHDEELRFAILNLVRDTAGIVHDDLTIHVSRLYGWNRRGPDITARLSRLIDSLVNEGILRDTDGGLTLDM
jgi:hypothetical protein